MEANWVPNRLKDDSRYAEVKIMPHPLPNDLREHIVAFVEARHSCHEAALHFDTSVSFAANLMSRYRKTGSVKPRPIRGKRHGKLEPAEVRRFSG